MLAVAILGGTVAEIARHRKSKIKPPVAVPVIATQPATQPTTRKAPKPKYPTYMGVIRDHNPSVAATQPLDFPMDLSDSAHLIFHDPTYLDPIGNLWITRGDGQPADKALLKPAESEEHIITELPVFAHWWWSADTGKWSAAIVVRGERDGFDLITKSARKHLADNRSFRWNTAFSVLGKIVVCTDVGVSVFDVEPEVREHYHALLGCSAKTNPPVTTLDTRGVLAWSPWENGKPGSTRISRFIVADDAWTDLPAADWPARPIQLSMLLDGSVLRIAAGIPASTAPVEGIDDSAPGDQYPDQIHLTIGQLDPTNFDEKKLDDLIGKLSDPDGDVRQAAFDELSRYGPAIAPLLEKVADQQLPAARTRIRQLLQNKIVPALGGLTVIDSRLNVVRRCADGTVIFFAPSGVQIPSERDEPDVLSPAWLALRPDGRMEHPLPTALIHDQKPDACTLFSQRDEWLVNDDAGIRRLVGNLFEPLLTPSEKRFSDIVGMGTRHRWVFRDPATHDTLVIDPAVADPTPKLPAWVIVTEKGTAGWDVANFPAVSRDEEGGNWELNGDGWKGLEKTEKVITELPSVVDASTQPATNPTTRSAPQSSLGNPILTTPEGTRYFDGKNSLIMRGKNGNQTTWPLPAAAVGTAHPVLMQTSDGLLFLFNEPGRLLRIRPTPAAPEPFRLEATFTKDIPNTAAPARVWLDPAGRIDFVSDENVLTITFPDGHIPKEISRMMLDAKP
jgi:hypothetical protein